MDGHLRLNFSHHFEAVIWNMVVSPEADTLVLELRDLEKKEVRFSALDLRSNVFIWRDKGLDEPWWVNLSLIARGVLVFTVYMDTNNPDKKGVVACALGDLRPLWWNNDFSVATLGENEVSGFTSKFGLQQIVLDIQTGQKRDGVREIQPISIRGLQKPHQYTEGSQYFETVKTFLLNQSNLSAVSALEYLETDKIIVISGYVENQGAGDLANFLIVLTRQGEVLLKESLSPQVKGIGSDTFFLLGDLLLFVKNKTELVSYTIL